MKNAVKHYGAGDNCIYALDHAGFQLEAGKICVILGPSGSGKSTLLNMIGGLDTLDEGSLMINGRDLMSLSPDCRTGYRKDDVGFVFQFYNLIADLTVEENIQVVADISDHPLPMDQVLDALEITQYRRRFPRELSGGQQQRVAIARAMIKNPKLLLCDELTGALDTHSSRTVLEFVEKMNAQFGTTIVIITHNEAIAQMAHQIIWIKDGKIDRQEENATRIAAADLPL